jgi:hypothetical protein
MSNDKQEMPVEWFIEQLRKNENIRWRGTNIIELGEQAKDMQKERMIEFAKQFIDVVNIEDEDIEIIYEQTYGGGEQ